MRGRVTNDGKKKINDNEGVMNHGEEKMTNGD
jgi:hypothetical protein